MCTVAEWFPVWDSDSPCVRALQTIILPCTSNPSFACLQAQKYAALKKPYLINDMVMQDVLLDRRKVYGKLQVITAVLPSAYVFWQKALAYELACFRRM